MRKRLLFVMVVVLAISLVSCGSGDGTTSYGSTGTGPGPASAELLAELLQYPPRDYNQEPSIADLGSTVDVAATGFLTNPRSARSMYGSPDDPYPTFRTIIFDLVEVETLGGNRPEVLQGGNVVIEMRAPNPMMGDDGLEEVRDALSARQRALFFLNVYDIEGYMAVEGEDPDLIYLAPHPQGAAFEASGGGTVTPTDPIPGASSTSFDDLVAAARAELADVGPRTTTGG